MTHHPCAPFLFALSAGILLTLGLVHLLYTFHGPKLTPRDPALQALMQQVNPVLTRQTTMWKAWVGFNASHSLGAILFGLLYGFLALAHPSWLLQSPTLLAIGWLVLGSYALLSRAYWFSVPNTGIALSCLAFAAGSALVFF